MACILNVIDVIINMTFYIMKTIIRNFFNVLRRFKMATVLNILGLSVAFAAFMVIMMQVDYDRTFDRFHDDADLPELEGGKRESGFEYKNGIGSRMPYDKVGKLLQRRL